MKSSLLMDFSVEKENSTIKVRREFAAPLEKVWAAWTERELLDQWWAPKPWKARTKSMDFREGGFWLYTMVGPGGDENWARADYKSVKLLKNFEVEDAFCDEKGTINSNLPRMNWKVSFTGHQGLTLVNVEIRAKNLADIEMIIEMGFKEGFIAALENLDDLLDR